MASGLFWAVISVIFIIRFFPLKWRWDTQPFHNCDRLSDKTIIHDPYDDWNSRENPRIDCYVKEIDQSPNPDVRWCFEPVFEENWTYMTRFKCAMRIALKLKSYSTCESYSQLAEDDVEEKWMCVGAVSRVLNDPQKCDSAPDSELKASCFKAKPGDEYAGVLLIGIPPKWNSI